MKAPTVKQAESFTWCLVIDGTVHAAQWERTHGYLIVLVEDDDGAYVCDYSSPEPVALADLVPWRERKNLGTVCEDCEEDVHLTSDILELWE